MMMITFAVAGLLANAEQPNSKKNLETVKLDVTQSTFNWHAKKVTGEHKGIVKFQNGDIFLNGNILIGGVINVDMTTIDDLDLSGEYHDKLVKHLKSDEFFAVEKYNTSTLSIKSCEFIKGTKPGENNYTVKADLMIKGITKEIVFGAFVVITKDQVVTNAEFNIDRTKYDIKYNSKSFIPDIGDKAIDDNFSVKVRVIAKR